MRRGHTVPSGAEHAVNQTHVKILGSSSETPQGSAERATDSHPVRARDTLTHVVQGYWLNKRSLAQKRHVASLLSVLERSDRLVEMCV